MTTPSSSRDLVRDVAARLKAHPGIGRFRVEAENSNPSTTTPPTAVVEG